MATNYQLYRPLSVVQNGQHLGPATAVGSYSSQALAMAAPSVVGDIIIPPGWNWSMTGHRPVLCDATLAAGSQPQYVTVGGGAGSTANHVGPRQ